VSFLSGNGLRNNTINQKWSSPYKNGNRGSYQHQANPLEGTQLINYRIEVAKKLAHQVKK